MLIIKEKEKLGQQKIRKFIKSTDFQRILAGLITVVLVFLIIESGAAPKKYKLSIGDKSPYDITAPRDIVNKVKTEQKVKAALEATPVTLKEIGKTSIDMIKSTDDFITIVNTAKKNVEKNLTEKGVTKADADYAAKLASQQEAEVLKVSDEFQKMELPISNEQISYLLTKTSDDEINYFKDEVFDIISEIMKEDITDSNLANKRDKVQNDFQQTELSQELKNIGSMLLRTLLRPNRTVDFEAVAKSQEEAYKNTENIVRILKDERIVSVGDTVTDDIYEVLKELNLLETARRFDVAFAGGLLAVMLMLAGVLVLYMSMFAKKALENRNSVVILCILVLLVALVARGVYEYSPLAIPIFVAAMSVSMLLDLKLAIFANIILSAALSFITKGDMRFLYMALISGTAAAFMTAKATQRSKMSLAGVITGILNVIIIVSFGIINKNEVSVIARDSIIVFLNGLVCIVITIGMLPFWETAFDVVTPLKLLELINPNQPLVKRLLMEAPGTYHHSLMVGNLAEVATEAIGGDALLARVGAYFHDIGKLRRPYFFKENQMAENPHDRMTANLSTLVITSHTRDGVEIAKQYRIPLVVRDIIGQHHGTTLVAYFYHKAKKGEKSESVTQENFRYEGPKPRSKEAAVVMLADSVEAAVRSMIDKTEGKIEGLVRKIIKEKLDDGQLDLCSLTLKDLDIIAKAFMRVMSGFFHAREEYPEVKLKDQKLADIADIKETDIFGEDEQQKLKL